MPPPFHRRPDRTGQDLRVPGPGQDGQPALRQERPGHFQELTEDKEITGEWTVVNKRLHVPAEGDFYFYEDPQRSPNFAANPDRVWTQIHRWFDWVPVDRLAAREHDRHRRLGRGRAVRRHARRVHWPLGRSRAPRLEPQAGGIRSRPAPRHLQQGGQGPGIRVVHHKGVPVDFNTGSLLVDFDGGRADLFYRDKGSARRQGPRQIRIAARPSC